MTKGSLSPISRFLQRIASAEADSRLSDAELLQHFVAGGGDGAFAALVRRHGPMVWAVCRRVLHNEHDAEDAFQATFLVLVRRAASLGAAGLLGGWLHGVAYRTALRVRNQSHRFQIRESLPDSLLAADPFPELAWRELQLVLDEEVEKLPQKCRAPFVLCYLEGKTYAQAARQLGWPSGTVSKRLARSRELMRVRLTRRGLGVSAGLLGTVLGQHASAGAVAGALMNSTIKAATTIAAGGAATPLVSAKVAALTKGVLKAMFMSKLKMIGVGWFVIVLGCLALGGTYRPAAGQQGQPPQDKPRPDAAPTAKQDTAPPKPRVPRVLKTEGLVHSIALSPDGKTAATVIWKSGNPTTGAVVLWNTQSGKVEQTLDESINNLVFRCVVFSNDGKMMATSGTRLRNPKIEREVKVWDARTGQLKHTFLEAEGAVWETNVAFSPDGKKVAAGSKTGKISVWDTDNGVVWKTMETEMTEGLSAWDIAFSPDGKLMAVGYGINGAEGKVDLWEVQTGNLKHTLADPPSMGVVYSLAFSPDGKSIAAGGVDSTCRLWDVETGALKHRLNGHDIGLRQLAFSADGKTLATAGIDKKIILWDIANEKARQTLEGHAGEVFSLAYSPDGKFLISGSADRTIRFWPISAPK
jgi:RNA polymerase sigma factor (sigma-70 family)